MNLSRFKITHLNILIPLLIILTTFIVWHKNLNLHFEGDSYDYFYPVHSLQDIINYIPAFNTFHYDFSSYVIYSFCIWFFQDNLYYYRVTQYLLLGTVYICLYFFLLKATKSKIISLLAIAFAVTNFNGASDILAARYFAHFTQRVPPLMFSFISLLFLVQFFQRRQSFYIILAGVFYFLSVALGQFASFLLPVFITLSCCYSYFYSQSDQLFKKIIPALIVSGVFLGINYLVVTNGYGYGSAQVKLLDFLNPSNHPLEKVFFQLPNLALPIELSSLIRRLAELKGFTWFITIFQYTTPVFILLYAAGGWLVYKLNRSLLPIYLTLLLGMIGHMFLYALVDERLNMLQTYGATRQMFISALLQSGVWAILFGTILIKVRKKPVKAVFGFLIVGLLVFNINRIWVFNDLNKQETIDSLVYIPFYKAKMAEFKQDTIVLTPAKLQWMAPFVYTFYSPPGLIQNLTSDGWEQEYQNKKDRVFVFDFDYKKNRVIDLTADYRQGKPIKLLN